MMVEVVTSGWGLPPAITPDARPPTLLEAGAVGEDKGCQEAAHREDNNRATVLHFANPGTEITIRHTKILPF